jgi:uroporphyrinogen-III decarboxylase
MKCGEVGHGHTFLKLCDIRGYQNVIYDMVEGEPRLLELIGMLDEFNLGLVNNFLNIFGAEHMGYAEDLGMQVGPMLSPELFRQYIIPSYRKIMKPAKDAGCIIHMHSDGDIRLLVNDILECGVDIINLQDLVNGIDWIAENLTGKVCVDLDVDRQEVMMNGTPGQIDSLIREEIEKLGSKEGGLMLCHGVYPGIPLENIAAAMAAMEKYTGYYA